jgi:hypothetical protein
VGWGMDWIELPQDRDRCPALVNGLRDTGFKWHTFNSLYFTIVIKMIHKRKWFWWHVSFLEYVRKCNEEVISITNPRKVNFF